MDELLAILTKAGVPGTLVAVLVTVAWIVSDQFRKRDALAKVKEPEASASMVKQLLDQISHTQKAESECARRISEIERELQNKDTRIASLEAANEAKNRQIEVLFEIILRTSGATPTSGASGRMGTWISEHFSQDEVVVLAVKTGLSSPIKTQELELQCQELVLEATRKNLLGELTRAVLIARPGVAPW